MSKDLTAENRAERIKTMLCLAMVGVIFFLSGCEEKEAEFDDLPKPVRWMKAEPVDHSVKRVLAGVLQPAANADLSFEVPGKIEEIFVTLGDIVAAGDRLATLEKKTFLLNVRQGEAQLQEAQARLVQAESDFERKENLVEAGAVSELQYEAAKSRYESIRNQVETLEAQLGIARDNLDDTSIHAPYAGKISRRYMEPSQQVQAGAPVLRIHDLAGLEVSIAIPETFVEDLEIGQRHSVRFPAYGDLTIPAKLTELAAETDSVGSFPAVLQLENTPERLQAGMTAEVTLELQKEKAAPEGNTFAIPLTAIANQQSADSVVFLYDEEKHIAVKTAVQIKSISEDTAFVTSGLAEGDIVITHGASFLHDGQAVTLIGSGTGWYQE